MAASTTGRAEASAFAGESHEMFMSAAIALNPKKAVFQPTTGEVVVKFLGDESRQLGRVFGDVS